jgi:hypothetical protein
MPDHSAPKIEDLAWMEGAWKGSVGADDVEETWSAPKNGSMIGMFRWFRDGKVRILEMIIIAEMDGGLTMKLKHFNSKLHSVEEPSETTDFILQSAEKDHAIWNQVTRDGSRQRLVYNREGTMMTARFERPDGGAPAVENPFVYSLSGR